MEQKIQPYICMGLVRLIGGILFWVVSVPLFYWMNSSWNLNVTHMMDIQTVGWPAYKALGLSFLGGMIALIIGQGIGSAIKIYNDNLATHITVYWHYFITGAGFWFLASNAAVSITFGQNQELLKAFYFGEGEIFIWLSFPFGGIMGLLTGIVLYLGGRKMRRSYYPGAGLFRIKVMPYIISLGLAYVHFGLFQLPGFAVLILGFLFPNIIIRISAYLWKRDMEVRGLNF